MLVKYAAFMNYLKRPDRNFASIKAHSTKNKTVEVGADMLRAFPFHWLFWMLLRFRTGLFNRFGSAGFEKQEIIGEK